MSYTTLMKLAEVEHGAPLRDTLLGLARKHGETEKVCQALGITRATLLSWRTRLEISPVEWELALDQYQAQYPNAG